MPQARKRILVRLLGSGPDSKTVAGEWFAGYSTGELEEAAQLAMLALDGRLIELPWDRIRWVCFVRELPTGSTQQEPERLLRRRFAVRPRGIGLWLRLTLTDGEELEGLADNDRRLVTGSGLMLTPPDMRSNTQRVFVPRPAIATCEVLSVVGARERARASTPSTQPELFPTLSPYARDTDTIQ